MKRMFRRMLRRCGIEVAFQDVVCVHHVKTVRGIEGGRIEVVDRRSLVFLSPPEADDMRDLVPGSPDDPNVSYVSPDAIEVDRTATRNGTLIGWIPREPIVRYALYTHQHGWITARGTSHGAVCAEFRCEMRTGKVDVELVTRGRFETGVAFKRPRWRRLASERSLIKYALAQLDAEGERPSLLEEGGQLHWKLTGPRLGDRYIYVAFEEHGLEQWRKRLEPQSLAARMWRLIRRPAQA